MVSWRFFSAQSDHDFVEWDFAGKGEDATAQEAATLFGILQAMGKEAYVTVHDQLGATACRILVPGYSEVYPVDDLIWDNTNKALLFRADVLNLHRLDDEALAALLERLENNELDDYLDIATMIGIAFDDNTVWGQLTVMELKLLIHLALQQLEEAHEVVGAFLQYNDNTVERRLFYQALNVVLEVTRDEDLALEDYEVNFRRMFGHERMDAAIGSVDGSVRFHGLTPTSLKGLHVRLLTCCPAAACSGTGIPATAAPPPDRQLQKTARSAGACGGDAGCGVNPPIGHGPAVPKCQAGRLNR